MCGAWGPVSGGGAPEKPRFLGEGGLEQPPLRDNTIASYRFCRPDDIPLVVRAVNDCVRPHAPDEPELTVERFRRQVREIDAWPSNCMVAMEGAGGKEPVGVSVGTKRETEVLVLYLGVRPDSLRRGHATHLVTSLSQKLAVLGPERLIAEVENRPDLVGFFDALGWRREMPLTDWGLDLASIRGTTPPDELVVPVTASELDRSRLLTEAEGVAWARSRPSLVQSDERLRGAAIVSAERIEAFALYEPPETEGSAVRVLAAGCADGERAPTVLAPLLRWLGRSSERDLLLPRLTAAEAAELRLTACGLQAGAGYHRWATQATPL